LLEALFGEGQDLTPGQMAARAVVAFFVALLLIRFSGRRSFGQMSPFDACVTVLLGAVLSRGVVGASPFLGTVAACAAMVAIHRLLGMASVLWPVVDRILNGEPRQLVRNGTVNPESMRKALVSARDLEEAVRKKTGNESLEDVQRAILERNGEITVIPMEKK